MFRKAERRNFPRFTIKTPQTASPGEGQLVDISLGGLSCRYLNDDGATPPTVLPLVSQDPLLARLPFHTIAACEIPHQDGKAWLRRIQFGEISDEQLNYLESFILNHSEVNR